MAEREEAEFHFFHEDLEPTIPYHKGITESQTYHDFHDHHEPIHHDDYHIWEESHYMPSFSVPIHVQEEHPDYHHDEFDYDVHSDHEV